jgi:hypothetical protein
MTTQLTGHAADGVRGIASGEPDRSALRDAELDGDSLQILFGGASVVALSSVANGAPVRAVPRLLLEPTTVRPLRGREQLRCVQVV